MWMFYSRESWTVAENLSTAVERLADEFSDLAFDACHAQNYDLSVCFIQSECDHLRDLEDRYREGVEVCTLYLSSEISLECLLYELVKLNFEGFIHNLKAYLPEDLKSRFIREKEPEPSTSSEEDS